MIKFENAEYLFLLVFLVPAYFLYFLKLKKIKILCTHIEHSNFLLKKLKLRTLFFSLSWISLVTALACPLYGSKSFFVHKEGLSVIFVMDVSKSMTIEDVGTDRLTAGKYFADFLINRYKKNAFGLVVAKGDGVLAVPLSFEHGAVLNAIMNLSAFSMSSAGTNLEAGVMKALNSFSNESSNFKIIVLITDGEETKGSLIKAAEVINKSDVIFIAAGIGSKNGGGITAFNEQGEKFLKHSSLNEKFLREAAAAAGDNSFYVQAFPLSGFNSSLVKIFDYLDSKNKGAEKIISVREPVKRNFEFSLFAFIFFCLGFIGYYEIQKI